MLERLEPKEGEREKFDAQLTEPLPGQKISRHSAEDETDNLLAFAAQIGMGGG